MECNGGISLRREHDREGHDFQSCRSSFFTNAGFSRWGEESEPQGLKPSSVSTVSARLEVVPFPCVHLRGLELEYRKHPLGRPD
jgi:hypothetical protein